MIFKVPIQARASHCAFDFDLSSARRKAGLKPRKKEDLPVVREVFFLSMFLVTTYSLRNPPNSLSLKRIKRTGIIREFVCLIFLSIKK